MLRGHVRDGMTLVLTTQYLEEADRLADEVVVLDHGRVAAAGRPAELKARYGGDRIDVTLSPGDDVSEAAAALAAFADGRPVADEDAGLVTAPVRSGTRLIEVVRALDAAGVDATDVHRRDATLDDVFLALTTDAEPVPTP
jgi:ABC-type multidrug transport system ATPase subunit